MTTAKWVSPGQYLNAARSDMLRKHSWPDEAALVESRCEASVGRMVRFWEGERSKARKKNERRRDKGCLIEAVSWWKWVLACLGLRARNQSAFKCGEEEPLKSSPAPSPPPPLFPNLQFPVLSRWAAALNFDERELEILHFLNSFFTALHLSSCPHPSSHACKVFR